MVDKERVLEEQLLLHGAGLKLLDVLAKHVPYFCDALWLGVPLGEVTHPRDVRDVILLVRRRDRLAPVKVPASALVLNQSLLLNVMLAGPWVLSDVRGAQGHVVGVHVE